MNIAIIPARGGSKRVPRKNIKLFSGKPMISYAISAAIESGLFDHVVVSTDDEEISDIATKLGAEVPFIRPATLADDQTPTVPVVANAIDACLAMGWKFDYVCCIYPCVPLLQVYDLKSAFELLITSDAGYSYPVVEFPSAIQRAMKSLPNGKLQPFQPQYEWTRTQDLEHAYYDAGQFYWGKVSSWLEGKGLQSHGAGLIIPQWRVVDIDTIDDWCRAELLFKTIVSEGVINGDL